jgi:hypothetical protein
MKAYEREDLRTTLQLLLMENFLVWYLNSCKEPGADWDQKVYATDQKAPATFPQNSFKRPLLRHFVCEIVKAPATSIALLLWPVRHCKEQCLSFRPGVGRWSYLLVLIIHR